MKILLISGHGAGDSGAVAKINGKTYKEATETIIMVKKIKTQLLKYSGVSVTLYPTGRNAYEDAKNGCLKVNFADYDYILEVHFNACVNDLKGNGKTTGVEIYITKADSIKKTETLIVEEVAKLGLKNRGVKQYDWTVINRAKKAGAESALLEICFIDDADDMKIYLANKGKIATKIANGIAQSYGLKKKSTSASSLNVNSKIKIKSGAKDANTGKEYKAFVYNTNYTVMSISGDYVIFGTGGVATGKTNKSNVTLV